MQLLTSGHPRGGSLDGHVRHDLIDVRLAYRDPRDKGPYAIVGTWLVVLAVLLAGLVVARDLLFTPPFVSITSLTNTAPVEEPFTIAGEASIPSSTEVWGLIGAPDNSYYVVGESAVPLTEDGSWSVVTRLGPRERIGLRYTIVALALDRRCSRPLQAAVREGTPGRSTSKISSIAELQECAAAQDNVRVVLR